MIFGFNLDYRGNRDAIVAEALLGGSPAGGAGRATPAALALEFEPSFIVALDAECYPPGPPGLETRNNSYQVRTGNYDEEPISVYFTVRGYPRPGQKFAIKESFEHQCVQARELTQRIVLPRVVRPIAAAIASSR